MRAAGRLITIMLCAVALLATTAAAAHARASAQYRIEGRGWGHGIGMSQYGANGFAERGWSGEQIIRHYFTGTVVAPRPAGGPTTLRVLLQSYLNPARLQLVSGGIVRQGDQTLPLAAGDIVEMRSIRGSLVVTRVREGAPNEILSSATGADATIVPAVDGGVRALFTSDHARYATAFRGTVTGHGFAGKVSVFSTVAFESYLRGVVPDEMPPSWHPEALEAQAIAARSYALRSLRTDFNWFDVYSDTRSQVYGGIGAEDARTDLAIEATAGQVARVGSPSGEVAQTFFFSTSGGRTAANEHVWSPTPYSYLRSVSSSWEHASPYFVWRGADVQRYTPRQLGAKLGYSSSFRSASNTVWPSGYAKDVDIATSSGTHTISGSSLQARFGLRSSYFRIVYLSIAGPDTVQRGRFATLSGRVPPGGATLVLRQAGRTRTLPLRPANPLGSWKVRARITDHVIARVSRSGLAGPAITVRAAG